MRFFLPCLVVLTWGAFAQEKSKQKTVAVLEFQSSGGLSKTEVGTLTNRFRGMLVQTKTFNVIEREKMGEILKEQDFSMTENCNSAECAVQVGQLLGAEQMITGDIGKIGDRWTIDLRLIDINTSKILQTQTGDYTGKIEGLLDIMTEIAYSFAGLKVRGKESTAKWWLIAGGVAILGGGAAVFLTGAKKGGGGAGSIPDPGFPQ